MYTHDTYVLANKIKEILLPDLEVPDLEVRN